MNEWILPSYNENLSPQSELKKFLECETHMKIFLSAMKSSAADMELKHWFTMMKNSAPVLDTQPHHQ